MDEILHSHVIEERAQQTAQAWKEARAAQVGYKGFWPSAK